MKLWRGHIEFDIYVVAEDADKAEDVLRESISEELNTRILEPPIMMTPVTRVDEIEPAWRDSIPYGAEDDMTCTELLAGKCAHGREAEETCPQCGEAAGQLPLPTEV